MFAFYHNRNVCAYFNGSALIGREKGDKAGRSIGFGAEQTSCACWLWDIRHRTIGGVE